MEIEKQNGNEKSSHRKKTDFSTARPRPASLSF